MISTLCVCCASPAACCWCRVSSCLFLMRKMFYLLKYNQSRITQARDKQVEENQVQSMKGCSHKEFVKKTINNRPQQLAYIATQDEIFYMFEKN